MKRLCIAIATLGLALGAAAQPAGRTLFNEGWTFEKDGESHVVNLPHDWGVEGAFRQEYPGETGKLPWWGQAVYRKNLTVTAADLQQDIDLEIDGAMSHATVWVNGTEVGGWPYGYASFAVRLNPALQEGNNEIAVRIDNPDDSSRWYPGGGLYRNVWLTKTPKTSVAHWGTYVTTEVSNIRKRDAPRFWFATNMPGDRATGDARIRLEVTLKHAGAPVIGSVSTEILRREKNPSDGKSSDRLLAQSREVQQISDGQTVVQTFDVYGVRLWAPDDPAMYVARTLVETEGGVKAVYETPFSIRSAEWKADGFYLNGEKTFLKGVCLHHDSGALGAVWNDDAWIRRLTKLKEMGCNAIRTAHNPPAPELLDLCDRMGFLVMDEFTDTWTLPKRPHGYAELFDEWAEKDLTAMIRRDRNHPSVILWSIGNECGEQGDADRWQIPQRLTDLCHREDPTRPTTSGNDNPGAAFTPYAATVDVYGFNYKPHLYAEFVEKHPGQPVVGSETASCISTRGYYRFPVEEDKDKGWTADAPYQVSSYDLYAPSWASKPDYEWEYEDQVPQCAGEFVWTGYDYLGEPTPFSIGPSRSSYFGIIDLAGFPKDRFWLYQSRWEDRRPVVHIVPHWTWPGREGKVTPVHVYTNGDEAELFVNGASLGRKAKEGYRIRWDDAVYQGGTVKVVVYKGGEPWAEETLHTAGPARKAVLETDYTGQDLTYVTARLTDADGNWNPTADTPLSFRVEGPGKLVATDAGDPTSLVPFSSPERAAFGGLCSAIVRRTGPGEITLTVSGPGLETARLVF